MWQILYSELEDDVAGSSVGMHKLLETLKTRDKPLRILSLMLEIDIVCFVTIFHFQWNFDLFSWFSSRKWYFKLTFEKWIIFQSDIMLQSE